MMALQYVRKTSALAPLSTREPTAYERASGQIHRLVSACAVIVLVSTAHQALLAFSAHLA